MAEQMKSVKIGKRTVPVMNGKTVARFGGGARGIQDKGIYQFWTAICLNSRTHYHLEFGRAFTKFDAGERFRRMEKERKTALSSDARKDYRNAWKHLKNVIYVRPSDSSEVATWLKSHDEDARYLKLVRFL